MTAFEVIAIGFSTIAFVMFIKVCGQTIIDYATRHDLYRGYTKENHHDDNQH
tara:strand:- start:536 stop:691 length:156 start_codon:yes stop_codon:yes gene_type:complete